MFHRNDMRRIKQVQLDAAHATTMTIGAEHICPETGIADFAIHRLQNLPPLFWLDVLKIKIHSFFA